MPQRPQVLYLDNDDAIDDITVDSPPPNLPTFLEDGITEELVLNGTNISNENPFRPLRQKQVLA